MPFIQSIKTEGLVEDARATDQWLIDQPEVRKDSICAMGFCMGGRAAYVANSELPLAAAISYYGGRIAPVLLDRAPNLPRFPARIFSMTSPTGLRPAVCNASKA